MDELPMPDLSTLYVHTKRRNWGLAILAWEGPGQRRYQFEDGQLRTFKEGYYSLIREVESPPENAEEIAEELASKLDVSRARRELVKQAPEGRASVITLDDQIEYFRQEYEGGFQDPVWNEEVRGEDLGRRLKKHRSPAIADAREKLSAEAVQQMLAEGREGDVADTAVEVMRSTNLTRPSVDMGSLLDLDEEAKKAMGRAVADLLHGEGEYRDRFARFLAIANAGGKSLTWPGATALAALVFPDQHVCVRPSTSRLQAKWVAPLLEIGDAPNAEQYDGLVAMNQTIEGKLAKAGLEPRDLMDVTEFSRITLRPAARKALTKKRKK